MKEEIVPLNMYGKEPKQVRTIHERDTAMKPSLTFTFSEEDFLEIKRKINANEKVINEDQM